MPLRKPFYDPDRHHRRSIRLTGFDYTRLGAYFVTICTLNQKCLFGEIVNDQMMMSEEGRVAQSAWVAIPDHFSQVLMDQFILMPNHIHGIVVIGSDTVASPLGAIIRSYKSAVSKRINLYRGCRGMSVWQSNYFEHVIRNETTLNRIRRYIIENPKRWRRRVPG